MNSLRFYIFFNIFNILLIGFIIFCVYVSAVLTFDIQGSPGSDLRFLYGAVIFITYFTLKLRLPKIFIKWAKKYDKSIISQFVYYLANRSNIKKKILAFAFCYDLPVLIYIISQYLNYSFIDAILIYIISQYLNYSFIDAIFYITVFYTILYAGGIFLFYLMLYKEIEKNKI